MSRTNVDSVSDCATDLETQQEEQEQIPEAVEAEPEISWEEVEDEWFDYGSEFLVF